jgi:hypothetical protein
VQTPLQVDAAGENMGLESYCWKKLLDRSSHSQQIQCTNTKGRPDIFINVDGRKEEIFLEKTGSLSSVTYVLDIRPLFVLKNCLPVTLHYSVGSQVLLLTSYFDFLGVRWGWVSDPLCLSSSLAPHFFRLFFSCPPPC